MKKFVLSLTASLLMASASYADVVDNSGAGFAIPDNNPAGASSTIVIGTNETINGNVQVFIRGFTHTWIGDLTATLTGPGGSATLFLRTGATAPPAGFGDSSDMNGDYTFSDDGANFWAAADAAGAAVAIPPGDYQASTTGAIGVGTPVLLNPVFFGTSTAGNWTLSINDQAGGDVGGITGWGFAVQSFAIPEPGFALLGLMGLGLVCPRSRRK